MEQEKAIQLAKEGHNIFLTGQAGTGKTYTLNKIIDALEKEGKIVAKTASTGISATYIDGTTIHSWSGIGIKKQLNNDDLFKLKNNKYSRRRIQAVDVLIIDEISMLHDYAFGLVDKVCRFVREKNDKPFGGIQIIVCGDFFQLPPVMKNTNKISGYCFFSSSWESTEFKTCYLTKIYRQASDPEFIEILNAIRRQEINQNHIKTLNSLSKNTNNIEEAVNLYSKNIDVDIENAIELNKIKEDSFFSYMAGEGVDFKLEKLKKNVPVLESLQLKLGAKIMTVINKPKNNFVNGTMGKIIEIDEKNKEITIKTSRECSDMIIVNLHEWKEKEHNGMIERTVARVKQLPLKLAWALTIHKSQGATFDFVNLDMTDVFTENMGYVALSRCTTLDGIYLKGYNEKSLQIDPIILKKDQEFIEESKKYE